jgi:uncharacterized protein
VVNSKNETTHTSPLRRAWRVLRPFLVIYLVILLGMMFLETKLVYPIPPLEWGNWNPKHFAFDNVEFTSADGTKLHGWFFPQPNSDRALLYCHGNGEDVAALGEFADNLRRSLGASVFVFDYRGYGHSEGSPNEPGCIADASAAQHWLANRTGIQPNGVILMGRSLGSAVAIALAADNGAHALVLESVFTTMPDVAALHYPWLPIRWIMKNRYDNLSRIASYRGPLLQTHGTRDGLIPIELARTVFDASPSNTKRWIEFPGLGHNDPEPTTFFRELAAFLAELPAPTSKTD